MKIQLSDHFDYGKLIRFTLPSIFMMIFSSIYGVVDGLFVSNYVGKTPFAAINLIMPFIMVFATIGFMIGTGGSALVSLKLGEGNQEKANELFSMLIYISITLGVFLCVMGIIFIEPIASMLGASEEMLKYCVVYGRFLLATLPFFILQCEFQSFCVVAEKPRLGLAITVVAGVTNMVLDALFIAVFQWGIVGAAAATATSQFVGGIVPLIYFALPNKTILHLKKCSFDGGALVKTCVNGSSEMISNLSMSLVNILYNYQLMRLAGENGVAAYGVIMYVNFIFIGVFLGYSFGAAPVISFHYGAGNIDELKSLRKKSFTITTVFSIILTLGAELLAGPLAGIFVGYDAQLFDLTKRGFMIYILSFLIMGYNMFASSFFTALNDGMRSGIISFTRALLFQVIAIVILPEILGVDGIWLAITVAELLSLVVSVTCLIKYRKRYQY